MPARQTMYGMLALQAFSNYVTRGALAPMIQFIVADLALTLEQKAMLLGAFFPVFTPFQVAAGPLCQIMGGKKLLSLNLFGMSALLLALPTVARVRGTLPMCACLAGIGICQGVLVPAQGQMKRDWLPDGPERVWGQRIIGLGMRVGYPFAAAAIPWIANRFGWRAVPYSLGGPMAVFSLLWHFYATERPDDEQEEQLGTPPAISKEAKSDKAMEWRIFFVPAIRGAMACHIAANNLGYCFLQWSMHYYNEVLGVSNVAAGWFISFPGTIGIWLPFVVGSIENRMRKKGVTLLNVRKRFSMLGTVTQAVAAVLFVVAPTPVLACASSCCQYIGMSFHGSGFSANYLEVGGKDTALMYAVANAIASIPGMVLPPVGLYLMRKTNSYLPLFAGCGTITMLAGLYFNAVASVQPARELLALADKEKGKHVE